MDSFVDATIFLGRFGYFIIAGSVTCAILNYAGIKKYLLPVTKAYCEIKELLHIKSQTWERELDVDAIFFWPENLDCRKHMISKISCDPYFCSYNKLQSIINVVRDATESVDVCMFILTASEIAQVLLDVKKKGVKVRVVNEEEMSSSSESKIQFLIHEGLEIKSKKISSFMHHKFCLIDANNAQKCTLLTGSLNWTLQGLTGNWENTVILRDREVIKQFNNEFNELWTYFDKTKKKPITPKYNVKNRDYGKYN